MVLKGNYRLFYFVEFITGILLVILFSMFGDYGLFGLGLFFIALFLTQKSDPDEREIYLNYKVSALEGVIIGAAMTIIYFKFPDVNWFYSLLYISMITRGLLGIYTFTFK